MCLGVSLKLLEQKFKTDFFNFQYKGGDLKCENAFPGISKDVLNSNLNPMYTDEFEAMPGRPADKEHEVYQDVKTTFFLLLAIYFPAVTGIMTGYVLKAINSSLVQKFSART